MSEYKTNIFYSHKHELIKLYMIIINSEFEGSLSEEYLLEKIGMAIKGKPIVLHPLLSKMTEEYIEELTNE